MEISSKVQKAIDQMPVKELSEKEYRCLPGFGAARLLNGLAGEIFLTVAIKKFKDMPDEIPIVTEFSHVEDGHEIWIYKKVIFIENNVHIDGHALENGRAVDTLPLCTKKTHTKSL